MTMTHTHAAAASETSGIFAEAIGGIATIALAIIALAGTTSDFLLAVATVVFGAALLIEGTSIITEYAVAAPSGALGLAAGCQGRCRSVSPRDGLSAPVPFCQGR